MFTIVQTTGLVAGAIIIYGVFAAYVTQVSVIKWYTAKRNQ